MGVFKCPNCHDEGLPADEVPCWKCGSAKVHQPEPLPAPAAPAQEPERHAYWDDINRIAAESRAERPSWQPEAGTPPAPPVPVGSLDGPRVKTLLDREYEKALDIINRQRERITELEAALRSPSPEPPATPVPVVAGYDAAFWHGSYTLLRDAVLAHLDQFVHDTDVAEEAILVEAIEKAGTALRSPSPEPPAPDVREGLRAQAQAWLDEWECMQPHEAPRHRDGYRFVVRLLSALSQPVPPPPDVREGLTVGDREELENALAYFNRTYANTVQIRVSKAAVLAALRAAAAAAAPEVPVLVEAFRFTSFHDWVNTARGRPWTWVHVSDGGKHSLEVCADAKGRICRMGRDFQRANDEGTFPVIAYRVQQSPAADAGDA
jgi:hypothetical protein